MVFAALPAWLQPSKVQIEIAQAAKAGQLVFMISRILDFTVLQARPQSRTEQRCMDIGAACAWRLRREIPPAPRRDLLLRLVRSTWVRQRKAHSLPI